MIPKQVCTGTQQDKEQGYGKPGRCCSDLASEFSFCCLTSPTHTPKHAEPDMVAYICKLNTQDTAEGSQVRRQPTLYSNTLSIKKESKSPFQLMEVLGQVEVGRGVLSSIRKVQLLSSCTWRGFCIGYFPSILS